MSGQPLSHSFNLGKKLIYGTSPPSGRGDERTRTNKPKRLAFHNFISAFHNLFRSGGGLVATVVLLNEHQHNSLASCTLHKQTECQVWTMRTFAFSSYFVYKSFRVWPDLTSHDLEIAPGFCTPYWQRAKYEVYSPLHSLVISLTNRLSSLLTLTTLKLR